jgi:hypothetical protein
MATKTHVGLAALAGTFIGAVGSVAILEKVEEKKPWTTFAEYQNPRTLKAVSYVKGGEGKSKLQTLYDKLTDASSEAVAIAQGAEGKSYESCGMTRFAGSVVLFYCHDAHEKNQKTPTFLVEGKTHYTHLTSNSGRMGIEWRTPMDLTPFARSWAESAGLIEMKKTY